MNPRRVFGLLGWVASLGVAAFVLVACGGSPAPPSPTPGPTSTPMPTPTPVDPTAAVQSWSAANQISYQNPIFSVWRDDGTFVTLVAQIELPTGAGKWARRESTLQCRHVGEGLTCNVASLDFSAGDPALAARAFLQGTIDAKADEMTQHAEPAVVTQTQQSAFKPFVGVNPYGAKTAGAQIKAETVWEDAVHARVHLDGAFAADLFLVRSNNRWRVTDQTFSGPSTTPIHSQWTIFTQPQEVLDLLPVGDDLWIASLGGAFRCNVTGGKCDHFTTGNGLVDNYVHALAVDGKGVLWFGTSSGVSRFDGKTWQDYRQEDGLPSADVVAIAVDESGAVWFGGSGGVSRFDGQTWRTYTQKDGLPSNNVKAIAVDSVHKGVLWVATRDRGVSRFDGQAWRTYTKTDGLVDDSVLAAAMDGQGAVWFGTFLGGASRFDGRTWRTYTTQNGLASNDVRSIAVDKQGALWFGTSDAGVSRFDGQTWRTYTLDDGLPSLHVGTIAADEATAQGRLWFGGVGGVSRFDATKP